MPSLPNDVLLLVGNFLEDHQDRHSLIFVCQRFYDLFLPLVYQCASFKTCRQIQSFLRPALKRPVLARAVRTLHFDRWHDKHSIGHIDITSEDRRSLSDLIQGVSLSDQEHIQWMQDLQDGVSEAWIALVLPLAINLRQLRLIYPKHNTYLDRTLQRAVNGEFAALRSLQEVSLSHLEDDTDDTKGNYLPSQILPFFHLPQMRAVEADTVMESSSAQETHGNAPIEPLPGASCISEINLISSNGTHGMESLIAPCSSLRTFKYQHSDSHLHSEGYRPSAFYSSLSGSKDTLETLWLDSCGNHLPFTIAGANETHDEWFGSLADFSALKHMRIRLPNLLEVRYQPEPSTPLPDILPRSLKSLYVEGCKENSLSMLLSQIQLVLTKRASQFPSLERVDIEGFFHEDEDYEDSGYETTVNTDPKVIKPRVYEMVRPVRAACAQAGIDLCVRDRVCLETMESSA